MRPYASGVTRSCRSAGGATLAGGPSGSRQPGGPGPRRPPGRHRPRPDGCGHGARRRSLADLEHARGRPRGRWRHLGTDRTTVRCRAHGAWGIYGRGRRLGKGSNQHPAWSHRRPPTMRPRPIVGRRRDPPHDPWCRPRQALPEGRAAGGARPPAPPGEGGQDLVEVVPALAWRAVEGWTTCKEPPALIGREQAQRVRAEPWRTTRSRPCHWIEDRRSRTTGS